MTTADAAASHMMVPLALPVHSLGLRLGSRLFLGLSARSSLLLLRLSARSSLGLPAPQGRELAGVGRCCWAARDGGSCAAHIKPCPDRATPGAMRMAAQAAQNDQEQGWWVGEWVGGCRHAEWGSAGEWEVCAGRRWGKGCFRGGLRRAGGWGRGAGVGWGGGMDSLARFLGLLPLLLLLSLLLRLDALQRRSLCGLGRPLLLLTLLQDSTTQCSAAWVSAAWATTTVIESEPRSAPSWVGSAGGWL